ncbi:hypothetical protein MKX08_000018 [Trichoderma sp. CBMAI-0020]|nr:hypothetical protein MKX08_000018 [Trichoderma sp. CBMAI-0020]
MVYLLQHLHNKKLPNIRINRPSNKLDFRKLKPFRILKKISEVNYKLDLPKNIRLKTAVFYILLLKKALVDKETGEPIINKIIVLEKELKRNAQTILREFHQSLGSPRNCTLHPLRPLSLLSTKALNLRTKLQPGLFSFFKLLI